jgi:hypothetical protein
MAKRPSSYILCGSIRWGNPENKVDYRDEVLQWKAPFTSAPSLIKTKQRFAGIMWGMKLLRSPWINGMIRATQNLFIQSV